MRRATLGLIIACGVAAEAQATNTKREFWEESAAEMGFGPCPAKVRSEAGIDSTQDWRIYADHGFQYCVPAWWTTRRPQPLHPDQIVWNDGDFSSLRALVAGSVSVPIAIMYPVEYPEGSRPGMWMGTIGGAKVEMWGDRLGVTAVFRSKELLFSAASRDRTTAEMQRAAIKSVRFAATSGSGNP